MATVLGLANDYLMTNTKRMDLDRRIRAIPSDKIDCKDILMGEMATVVEDLNNAVIRLAAVRSTNTDEMRTKAMVMIDMRDCDAMAPALVALGVSLAEDVAKLEAS